MTHLLPSCPPGAASSLATLVVAALWLTGCGGGSADTLAPNDAAVAVSAAAPESAAIPTETPGTVSATGAATADPVIVAAATTPMPSATSIGASSTAAAATATSTSFAPSTADFLNPERGFYITVQDSEMTVPTLTSLSNSFKTRLIRYRIPLDGYRASALPASFLDTLNTRFAAGRAAGVKFIVQASYNDDASGIDAPVALVLQHIAQLKPVLDRNADVIPLIKAGFIGAWGEWHTSSNGLDSDVNKRAIKDALLANTPASTIVHFRQSADLAKWYPNNPAGAAAARVGFHNDCYMVNDTDAHTYTGLNDPMRDYVKRMTENSGFGGETCQGTSNPEQMRLSCAQALSEASAYHLTWLNGTYAEAFLNSWKSGGCFDQISRSMGYRLQLDSVSHAPSAGKGGSVAVNATLRNTGWARLFSKRALVVTLRNKSTGATITGSGGDLTRVAAGATLQVSVNVSLPAGAAAGTYDVQLSAPDIWSTTAADPRFAVRFANTDAGAQAWDSATGRFGTGTSIAIQ